MHNVAFHLSFESEKMSRVINDLFKLWAIRKTNIMPVHAKHLFFQIKGQKVCVQRIVGVYERGGNTLKTPQWSLKHP